MKRTKINRLAIPISFLMLFVVFSNVVFAQNTDTVKVIVNKTVYDTVRIYNNVIKTDTIWTEPIIKSINAGISVSSFLTVWRKYDDEFIKLLNQRNISAGIETDICFGKWSLGTGLFFTSFSENRQFGFSITDIDSIINMHLEPHSYEQIDTTGVSWQYFTHDSTYYDPGLSDSVTITITDSIPTYEIDTTTGNYNDTTYSTTYDTITTDTVAARNFKYKYLEVPVIAKFVLYKRKKFSIDASLGIVVGILIKSESYYFEPSSNSIMAYAKNDTYSFLPSAWISAGFNYNINDKLLIRLEPYCNPGLRSVYKKELPIVKIPDRYGLKMGVRYVF